MNIQYIGALASYAYRLTATPDLLAKLRLAKTDDTAAVWILDNIILKACCNPYVTLSYKVKPGMHWICFGSVEADTVWAMESAESQRLQERIDLIFGYQKELALLIAMQNTVVTDDFLPSTSRKKEEPTTLYVFDKRIEELELLRKLEKNRLIFSERQQPITAKPFENLLTHYGLWKKVQPRVKHFIRQFVTCIHPNGRHTHHHPVGLTRNRRLELENIAREVAAAGASGLFIKKEIHHGQNS